MTPENNPQEPENHNERENMENRWTKENRGDVDDFHEGIRNITESPSLEELVTKYGFKDIASAKRALMISERPLEDYAAKGELPPGGTDKFVKDVLTKAEKGNPGLTVGKKFYGKYGMQIDIVYRSPEGNPVARAELIADVDPIQELMHNTIVITGWKVKDFATDKSKGILSARAAYAIGEEIIKMDALKQSSSISPDALRLLHGYCTRKISKVPKNIRDLLRTEA